MATVDYATFMRGTGMHFSVGMFSTWQLAVVRSGDLPVRVPGWNPLTPLPSFDPERPFYFLVRQNDASPWQYLFFVKREFTDWSDFNNPIFDVGDGPHASVLPSPWAPSAISVTEDVPKTAAEGNTFAPYLTSPFRLRANVLTVYNTSTKRNCSIPAEMSTDAGRADKAASVQQLLRGASDCDEGCGPSGDCNCANYAFQDNDYICKVATLGPGIESKVFAVIPEALNVIQMNMKACRSDGFPSSQGFLITDTLDKEFLWYIRYKCRFYLNFNPEKPIQTSETILLKPWYMPREVVPDTRTGLAAGDRPCTTVPAYINTVDYNGYMAGGGMEFSLGIFSSGWELGVFQGPGTTLKKIINAVALEKLDPYAPAAPYYFGVRPRGSSGAWQLLYFVQREFNAHASIQDNTVAGTAATIMANTPASAALSAQTPGPAIAVTALPSGNGVPLTVAQLGPLFQFRRRVLVAYIEDENHAMPAEMSVDAKSSIGSSPADFLWGQQCTLCDASSCMCTTYSLRDNDFTCKVATVGAPGQPPKVFALIPEALDVTRNNMLTEEGARFPLTQGFVLTDTMDEDYIWYTRRDCKFYVTFRTVAGNVLTPTTNLLQPGYRPRGTMSDGAQTGSTSVQCRTGFTPSLGWR